MSNIEALDVAVQEANTPPAVCPLTPLGDRVVMKRARLETTIIIPEASQKINAPQKGTVVAIGPACEMLDEGDIGNDFLHGQYAGAWFNKDGTVSAKTGVGEYYIVSEADLVAGVRDV